jgi:putative FmdB family regulatory protein
MPTYEYQCTKCEKQFEIVQRITDEPKKRCPDCRGKVILRWQGEEKENSHRLTADVIHSEAASYTSRPPTNVCLTSI